MANEKPRVRWQDLNGEERYRVIELMRQGGVEIKELCRSFGVSRQTLYRAKEAADQADLRAAVAVTLGLVEAGLPNRSVWETPSLGVTTRSWS